MRGKLIAAAFVLLCLAAGAVRAESDVTQLTTENFDALTSQGVWLLELYAPWCGFCQMLEPEWDKTGTWGKANGIHVGRVDCDAHKMLCRRFEVTGYPTIKLIANNKLYDFPEEGERNLKEFKEFATTQYLKLEAKEIPVGNSIIDPVIAVAEIIVVDLMHVYDNYMLGGIALFFVTFVIAAILSVIILPSLVGFGPTFIVPRTIHVLRRPGQRPVIVKDPSKYKIKND